MDEGGKWVRSRYIILSTDTSPNPKKADSPNKLLALVVVLKKLRQQGMLVQFV
jgi:hypothetical protein